MDAASASTRQALIEAAGEVFAEHGFRTATVREICQKAGANIAAVNYHFGDKEGLYAAVMKETSRMAFAKYPPDFGLSANATADERLRAFVRSFLLRIFSDGPQARHGKLMAREMVEPTPTLDMVLRDTVRPQAQILWGIVGELLGPAASAELIKFCGMSVVSQIVFYHHCRPVISRLFPEIKMDGPQIERLADHITGFSLSAIQGMKRKNRK